MRALGLFARLSYAMVSRAPSGPMGRARAAGRLAPVLERAFAVAGAPLDGLVVPVASGPGKGIRMVGERRALAWISGGVEREVQEVLVRHLASGGTFVDVGASVGFFSLLGARLVGTTGHVVAFEPQPAAAASISRNAEENGFANVVVVSAAVGAIEEELFLHGVGTATAHVSKSANRTALRVAVTSLDAYVEQPGRHEPDLVKIDVEGHERDVLLGMRSVLAAVRPVVVVECHGAASSVVDLLEEVGYSVSVVGSAIPAREAPVSSHLLGKPTI